MPKSATERDKYFQKLKMDDVPKLSITSSEWQNDRPNWSEDVVLLDLQASTLMLDPINMYRDEISLSQAKDPTGDEEKQNKSSSAVVSHERKSECCAANPSVVLHSGTMRGLSETYLWCDG